MAIEIRSHSASLETTYWLKNQGGQTPASTTLHPEFMSLIKPGALFLDVGCGYGRITHQLTALGARVVAVDPNLQELLVGRKNVPTSRFIQAYGEKLPFAQRIFDGVVMLGVLGAVSKRTRQEILDETIKALRVGGLLYVAEFALITDLSQKTNFDQRPWIDVYLQDSRETGEYGSVVVHDNNGGTHFIAHHFTHGELFNLLRDNIDVQASRRVAVQSKISGRLRDNLNIWGIKH